MNKRRKAIMYIILSAFCLIVMQMAVKLSGNKIPLMQQVFCRSFFTLIIGAVIVIKRKKKLLGSRENQSMLLLRSLLGFVGVVAYFYATQNMLAADATILHRSSSFFVTIFSCIFLKEKLTKIQPYVLLLAFTGAIFVVRPQFDFDIIPALGGVVSAAASGGAYTVIGYLKDREDSMVIVFYFSLVSCLICIPFMIINFVIPDIYGAIMLIIIALFAGLGQVFLTIAYKNAPASEVSIYNYSGIIFSCILGYIFLSEVIDEMSIIGMAIILVAAIIMYMSKKFLNIKLQ